MVQFAQGSPSRPSSLGRYTMLYSKVMKPGASMIAQAHFPGRLKRDSIEVLPCG